MAVESEKTVQQIHILRHLGTLFLHLIILISLLLLDPCLLKPNSTYRDGYCYESVATPMSWSDAAVNCQPGVLVNIDTEEAKEQVQSKT